MRDIRKYSPKNEIKILVDIFDKVFGGRKYI